ncbi:MAG: hypothetical protein CBC42_02230 [Betaproteobacteria bacterium TMED82]|nr:MAG: hypothetical protein CBC42_02230 [Betaproteobacteria bacterium TMED82]|tara:strand:- start:19786 stop:20706 length:921 start_codon:yes stop_codon:yes gene_type:complete
MLQRNINDFSLLQQMERRRNFLLSQENFINQRLKNLYADSLSYLNYSTQNSLIVSLFPRDDVSVIKLDRRAKKATIFAKKLYDRVVSGKTTWPNILPFSIFKREEEVFFYEKEKKHKYRFEDDSFNYIEALPVFTWSANPEVFFLELNRLLKPEGLVGFASFGLTTLEMFIKQLSSIVGIGNTSNFFKLIDLHDIGDICVRAGFSDPIVSSQVVKVKYKSVESAFRDLRSFLMNPSNGRFSCLRGKGFKKSIEEALKECQSQDGNIELTVELIYGHAWKIKRGEKKKNLPHTEPNLEKKIQIQKLV